LDDPKRREPDREVKGWDKYLTWALGLSILALGAALVPAGGPLFFALGVLFAIGATVSLAKGLDSFLMRRGVILPPNGEGRRHTLSPPVSKEREILSVLRDQGTTTPVEAAIETSLTVKEADEILSELAGGGHLMVESKSGVLYYSLPGQKSRSLER
jgi:hypothetical protein